MCHCSDGEYSTVTIVIYGATFVIHKYYNNSERSIKQIEINNPLPAIPSQTHQIYLVFYDDYCDELVNNISKWLLSNKFCKLIISVNTGVRSLMTFLEIFRFTHFESLSIRYECDVSVKYKKNYNQELNYIESFLDVFRTKYPDIEIKSDIWFFGIIYDD